MRKATLVSVIVVVFLVGSAFGFYIHPLLTSQTSHQASGQVYALAFTQQGACSGAWGAPWSVALNGSTTVVEPSNASLPLPNNEAQASPNYQSYSVILFHVSDGVYTYVVSPHFYSNGTVTMNGADTIVTVAGPFIMCAAQTST